jgi:hypothetical protein
MKKNRNPIFIPNQHISCNGKFLNYVNEKGEKEKQKEDKLRKKFFERSK